MAYNNYFPQTYTSPSYVYGGGATPAQTWTTPAPTTSQQINAINWVQGEAGAKAVPVAPGQKALLMDSETNVFYVKSSDVNTKKYPRSRPMRRTLGRRIRMSPMKNLNVYSRI